MNDYEKEYKALEEKYYPVTWEITSDSEIKIWDKDGKLLPKDHKIHSIEWNFIYDQINKYHLNDGEIVGI